MELNNQQKAAAEYDGGHVLVIAGAGTGKTRTLIARAAHLIQNGIKPYRILLLTFTRRASKEMINRLEEILPDRETSVSAGTFHHFCLYTMRRMPKLFGLENATIIDRDDQLQLMKLIRGKHRKKGEQFPSAAELVNLGSYARNTLQPMEKYISENTDYDWSIIDRICQIQNDFDTRKKQNNYLDYDDILFLFSKHLHENPDVREKLRGYYDHILVDEMQDTNPLQWLVLDGLRDPAKLFCVGDDAQSIYAFRGADFQNIHSFTSRVPNSTILRLEKNYRSTQGILDLSNWLLHKSTINYNKNLEAVRKTQSTPGLHDFNSDIEEARWVAKDLIERHENGSRWDEHMIITRTGYGARAVESSMIEKKIPYRFIGGMSFLQAAHVKDIFALVRAAASHHDELSWARYLTLWPKIGDVTAARLIEEIKKLNSVHDAVSFIEDKFVKREIIPYGLRIVLKHWNDPPNAIKNAAKFLEPVMMKKYDNWNTRKYDFNLLERLAKEHRSLVAFIETYILDPISTASVKLLEEDDVVTLTTVHSAKGTEAPVCYVIRAEPNMYPHSRSLGNEDSEEEERRILYVAITRAQDELILTRSLRFNNNLSFYGGSTDSHSEGGSGYFLEELGEPLVEANTQGFSNSFSDYDVIQPWRR